MKPPVDQIDQLVALRMGVEYRQVISVRGLKLKVRPISITETVDISQEVNEQIQELPERSRNRMIEHTLVAKKTICLATTSAPGVRDPHITERVLDEFTPAELDLLFKEYVAVTDRVNPSLEMLKADEIDRMVAELKKSPSEAIELSFLDLVSVVRFLLTREDSPPAK